MPQWNQTLRIRGSKLGVSDTYVDVTLEDYSISGHVRLVEDVDQNPRTWDVAASNLDEWKQNNVLAPKGQLSDPDDRVWSLIAELDDLMGSSSLAPVEGEVADLVDELFKQTTRGHRQVGNSDSTQRDRGN